MSLRTIPRLDRFTLAALAAAVAATCWSPSGEPHTIVAWILAATICVVAVRVCQSAVPKTLVVTELALLACWSQTSRIWSDLPGATQSEAGIHALIALAVTGAAVVAASAARRGALLAIPTLLAVVVSTDSAVRALGHFGPDTPRIVGMLGYWNAAGLCGAWLAICAARALAASPRMLRAGGVLGASVAGLCLAGTSSRGAVGAAVVALIVLVVWSGERARMLGGAIIAAICVAVPLASYSHAYGWVFVACVTVFGSVLVAVVDLPSRGAPLVVARTGRWMLSVIGAAVVVTGSLLIPHAWHTFTTDPTAPSTSKAHLLSATSNSRSVWWREAISSWKHHALVGNGDATFSATHYLHRTDASYVDHTHSVALDLLAGGGLVAALVALVAVLAFVAVGWRNRRKPGTGLAFALVVALAAQSLVDWTYDLLPLALAAAAAAGVVLAGARRAARGDAAIRRSIAVVLAAIALAPLAAQGVFGVSTRLSSGGSAHPALGLDDLSLALVPNSTVLADEAALDAHASAQRIGARIGWTGSDVASWYAFEATAAAAHDAPLLARARTKLARIDPYGTSHASP